MAKREDVYDTEINPLMAQIIAICQAHDIPMATLRRAAAALKPRQTQWAVYVEHGDGSRECVAGSHVPGGGE